MSSFVPLEQVGKVALGYKSLQNNFYYLNQATIDTYGIEPKYLKPILVFRDLNGRSFFQKSAAAKWIFLCSEKEVDLRGTGALKYIHAMSEQSAADKKQSGAVKTMREALEAQGGGIWYAPKAKPHASRLWMRKAVGSVYAPFIFKEPQIVDQRCNYLEPAAGLDWRLLAAALSSTVFAYAIEINGSASMGAGALEAPTSKLRRYPVFDIRMLSKDERTELIGLAVAFWDKEQPLDWSVPGSAPGPHLQALDDWFLVRSKAKLKLTKLYEDLRDTCASRIAVAEDKVRTTKKRKTENVATVAQGIAEQLARLLSGRQFPEGFCNAASDDLSFHIDRKLLRRVSIEPFLDQAEIKAVGEGGRLILSGHYKLSVAEAIVRSILLGREHFKVPSKADTAAAAIGAFLSWFDDLRMRIDSAISESALGTGYEDALRAEVYRRLGVHSLIGDRALPHELNFAPSVTNEQG